MDYSHPHFKSKEDKLEKKIIKKHMKGAVEKVLRKHEKGETKKEEKAENC